MPKSGAISKRGMGTLRVRGNNYYLQFSDDGKLKCMRLTDDEGKPITSRKAAEAAQMRLLGYRLTGDKIVAHNMAMAELKRLEDRHAEQMEQSRPPLSLEDAWGRWCELADCQCGEGSKRNYEAYWRQFVTFCRDVSGNAALRYVRDITPDMARARVGQLETQGMTGNTINKHVMFLKSFFGVLMGEARMAVNPFDGIRRREAKAVSRRMFTVEELEALASNSAGELHSLVVLGMTTALRLEDCCRLKWCEVDMVAGLIRHIPFKTAHSSGKCVVIPIEPVLRSELGLLRSIVDENAKPEFSQYVLPGMAEDYLRGRSTPKGRFKRLLKRCGIKTTEYRSIATGEEAAKFIKGVTRPVAVAGFHSLRHTWISLQLERNTPVSVVMSIAGHTNLGMTSRYTHVDEKAALKAARLFVPSLPSGEGDIEALRARVAGIVASADADLLNRIAAMAEQGAQG